MSAIAAESSASAFFARFVAREGGLAEVGWNGAVDLVLTPRLRESIGLPEVTSVRILGETKPGEVLLPLESAGLRWCLETACACGRIAGASLAARPVSARGLAASAAEKVQALNGALRAVGVRSLELHVLVLEFRCEAVSEERQDLAEYVAVEPRLGLVSAPWAQALLEQLPLAAPSVGEHDAATIANAAGLAEPLARRLLSARLEPLRARLELRMGREAARLIDYHQTLLDEARKRRRSLADDALDKKLAAITRQRDQKLAELGARLAIDARVVLASVLEVRYSATVCELMLLRKKREMPLLLPWDPFLRGLVTRACQACRQPSSAFHVCDQEGHQTCATCAQPCVSCSSVTCRACRPRGCRGCERGGD